MRFGSMKVLEFIFERWHFVGHGTACDAREDLCAYIVYAQSLYLLRLDLENSNHAVCLQLCLVFIRSES
jgi:hypothetical protein